MSDYTELKRAAEAAIAEATPQEVESGLDWLAVRPTTILQILEELERLEREKAEAFDRGMRRAAEIAADKYPIGSAHTYASENADLYRAQEFAGKHISDAILAAAEKGEKK